jgi:hypothetical protein
MLRCRDLVSPNSAAPPVPKLGIVAGRGRLPVDLARACAASGREVFVLGIEGETSREIEAFSHAWVRLGQVGRARRELSEAGCQELCLIGPVSRPDFSSLRLDWEAARHAPRLALAARRGDDALLSAVVELVEGWGFRIVAAEDLMLGLRAPAGLLGAVAVPASCEPDIRRAFEVARLLGQLDIGQGAVVCDGLVLALEAVEGTDAMLRRCAGLPEELRGQPGRRRGVLLKCAKPGQERRVDLPTIGPNTVELAAAAGLAGIAVEAGGTLVLERDELVRRADAQGLFVVGVAAPEPP